MRLQSAFAVPGSFGAAYGRNRIAQNTRSTYIWGNAPLGVNGAVRDTILFDTDKFNIDSADAAALDSDIAVKLAKIVRSAFAHAINQLWHDLQHGAGEAHRFLSFFSHGQARCGDMDVAFAGHLNRLGRAMGDDNFDLGPQAIGKTLGQFVGN